MGQTTTAINACNVIVDLDNAAGVPVDISGSSNTASLGLTRQVGSANTFDGDYPIRIECKKDGSLALSVIYTRVATEALTLLRDWFDAGGRRTVAIYPAGKDTGEDYFSAEWRIEGLEIPLDASDANPVVVSATLVPDGAISFLKYAS